MRMYWDVLVCIRGALCCTSSQAQAMGSKTVRNRTGLAVPYSVGQ